MVTIDRWFLLGLVGLAIMALAALGEFVFHWWDDLGDWSFWVGVALTLFGFLVNATREQAKEIRGLLHELLASSARIEANTAAIGRIEANTAAIGRIEANTEGLAPLLREIRDRLPPPPRSA